MSLKLDLQMTNSRCRPPTDSFRVALVDSDVSVHAAIKELVKDEKWALEYYPNGRQALRQIPFTQPDIVLMDVLMPGLSGMDCLHKLKCHKPDLSVVMLTACTDYDSIIFSLMAGATGYLLKPFSGQQLKETILRIIRGGTVLCEEAQNAMICCLNRAFLSASTKSLSKREMQILACLIQNMPDKEISEHLNISHHTVHVYLGRIFRCLNAHSRDEAVKKFFNLCFGNSCCHCRLPMPDKVRC